MLRLAASWSVAALGLLAAARSPAPSWPDVAGAADAAPDAPPPGDAPDPHGGLRLPRCEDTEPMGTTDLAPVASTLLGTVEPEATRLSEPATRPTDNPVSEAGELNYRVQGLDRYRRGGGEARVRRTDLGATTAGAARRSLAYFVHLSDFQLVDDESPLRVARLDQPTHSGGLRPQEALLPRAVSAMNRTLAALARPERGVQFGAAAAAPTRIESETTLAGMR